jgi:hypothetical protein
MAEITRTRIIIIIRTTTKTMATTASTSVMQNLP